jgi:hypothetical protein
VRSEFSLDAKVVDIYRRQKDDLVRAGFSVDLLKPQWHPVIQWLDHYTEAQSNSPTVSAVREMFGHFVHEAPIQETELTPEWAIQELTKRRVFDHLVGGIPTLVARLERKDIDGAVGELGRILQEMPSSRSTLVTPELTDMIEPLLVRLDQAILGSDGLKTPWATLNSLTRGIAAGTSTWFMARPGVGKTWIVLIIAISLWMRRFIPGECQPRILVVSPELKKLEMAERAFALATGASYAGMVRGLNSHTRDLLAAQLRSQFVGQGGFGILDEDDGLTPENIEAHILAFEPDVVVFDSAYEIAWGGPKVTKDKEKMDIGCSFIRKWTRKSWPVVRHPAYWNVGGKRQIAILVTTQENRESLSKESSVSIQGRVGITDRITQTADNLFELERSADDAADSRMRLIPAKVRRPGSRVKEIVMEWDLDGMHFGEVGVQEDVSVEAVTEF